MKRSPRRPGSRQTAAWWSTPIWKPARPASSPGDIARWPDPHSGAPIRVEHWVVSERQGQAAAENMLGGRRKYTDAPFFWSRHYDMSLNYVGHAESWDAIDIDGDIAAGDYTLRYKHEGRTLAVVTMGRDIESLADEAAMEAEVAAA